METSDRLLTVNQRRRLERLIGELKAEKIMPLLNLFVDMEYETKKSIYNFCFMSGQSLILSSNSNRKFIQVGGPITYAFLVASFQIYQLVVYIGILSDKEQEIFSTINNYCKQNDLRVNIFVTTDQDILQNPEQLVVSLFDECMLSMFESIEFCELYLPKNLAKKCLRKSKLSQEFYLNFRKKHYLVVENFIIEFPLFQKLLDLEYYSNNKNEFFNRAEIFSQELVIVEENQENLADELHIAFLNLNRQDILYKFYILCALFLKEVLLKNENDLSYKLLFLFSANFFTWTVYFILFRTVLSSLIVTLLDESRQIYDFTNIEICI